MGVSTDYSLDYTEAFKNMFGDMSQAIEGDSVIKTVNIMIRFQTRQSGVLWGDAVSDQSAFVIRNYPITPSNIPSDKELLDRIKSSKERSDTEWISKLGIEGLKEVIELLYAIELHKYPTLLDGLCQLVREMDDEALFNFIQAYQLFVTSTLPDESSEKIEAKALAELSITSVTAQALLLAVRRKLNESSSMELYRQGRAYLLDAKPVLIQFLEQKVKEDQEREATLQLSVDSEKVQQLIAPLRDNELKRQQAREISKVVLSYKEAVWKMQSAAGEKNLSSIDVKVVYAKRSNPDQDLIYEKKYSSTPK